MTDEPSLSDALDALAGRPGLARAGGAEVDVTDVDRLGVRVRRVTVARAPVDVAAEAAALPGRLRALPERVAPVEVAPELGGARLRTTPDELRGREFFEVDVEVDRTTVTRTGADADGRSAREWTMTREQLDRLVRELEP